MSTSGWPCRLLHQLVLGSRRSRRRRRLSAVIGSTSLCKSIPLRSFSRRLFVSTNSLYIHNRNRPRKPLNRKDFGFRKCWLAYTDLKKWMVEKNNHAWCTYCQREVLGDLSDMVWHQTSAEHRQRQGIVTRRPANTVHIVASSSADDEMAGDNDDGSVEDYSVKGARLDNDEESCPRSSSTPTTNTDPDGVVVVYVNHAYVNVNHECNISSEDPLGLENDMHVQPNDCESETDADDRVTDVDEIEEPTDERSTSDSTKPTFNTRFRRSWLQDDRLKTWMLERNGGAYCRFCCVAVSGGITHMHRHETATRHKRLWRKGCSIVELYRAARPSDASCTDVDVSVPTAKQSPSDSNWLTSTRPFKQQWLEDAELKAWMLERDGMAYCRFCCIAIVGGLTHMYRHGATTRHKEQCGKGSSILSNLTDPLDPVPSNNGCSSLIGMRSASSAQNR